MRPIRLAFTLVPFLLAASPLVAELVKYKEWDRSPEFNFLATDDERKAWKKVSTDDDGEKFLALFWARRDPDIKTPQNEFRARFEALVAKSDELFKTPVRRGALTERGKLLILVGPPKAMSQRVEPSADTAAGKTSGFETGGGGTQLTQQFVYEQAQLPPWADLRTLTVRIRVDTATGAESILGSLSDVRRLEKKAAEKAVVNSDLKQVPVYKTRGQVEAELKAANEAAADAARGPALAPGVRTGLEALLTKESHGSLTLFPLAFRDGATRIEAQLFVPGGSLASAEGLKLVLLARGKDEKDAARRDEVVVLAKSKGDWYADRALLVSPGDYDVAVELVDAAGKAVYTARKSVSVTALPTDFAMSPLLLAYADVAADGARPDDPFVYSQRKFVSRGEGKFEKADGLSYAFRIYNPGVDPVTRKTSLKRSIAIKPKSGPPQEVPLPPDEPALIPENRDEKQMAVVIDLAGNIVDANLGDYFRPGEYEFRVKVTDGVLGKTVQTSVPFSVVGPPPSAPARSPKKK